MLSYTICCKLKEAGFPQELKKGDWYFFVGRKGLWLVDSEARVSTMTKDQYVKCPTISQLIKECYDENYVKKVESDLSTLYLPSEEEDEQMMHREEPVDYIWHKRLKCYVPVIETDPINQCITWDDGQITRTIPPSACYEIDEFEEFDLSKRITKQKYEELERLEDDIEN